MRWVVFCFVALFAAQANLSPAAMADEKGVTIKITVRDADGKPVQGAHVSVATWPVDSGVRANGGDTDKDGSTTITTDSYGTPFAPGSYRATLYLDGHYRSRIVYVGADGKTNIVLDSDKAMKVGYESGHTFKNAADAKAQGNTASYKNEADDIRTGLKQDERLADEAAAAAEAFARDNGLRVTNLGGAQKDLRQLQKLGDLGDQDKKAALERYIEQLQAVEQMRQNLDANKQRFAELEERKFSLGPPSACPEGQSGGLLAGGINSLFGTDLAGVCDDKQPRRRDTDRPAGGDRDKHERKD